MTQAQNINYKYTVHQNTFEHKPNGQYVWLQYVGWVKGKPADELKAGDIAIWNFGGLSKIHKIVNETKCFITIQEKSFDSDYANKTFIRRFKKNKIIGIAYQ